MESEKPSLTIRSAMAWIAVLAGNLAIARLAPGLAFTIGVMLTLVAVLCYVPSRPIGNARLDETIALLVLLAALTVLAAPSNSGSNCNVLQPQPLSSQSIGSDLPPGISTRP